MFYRILDKKNLEKLSKILEANKNSNIIIVGMTIFPPEESAVQGYSIDISIDDFYYQLNLSNIESICSNCGDLKDLIKKEPNKYKADLTMLFKYKIRQSFPIIPDQIDKDNELRKKYALEMGYKYLSQEKIVEDIISIISKSKPKSKSKHKAASGKGAVEYGCRVQSPQKSLDRRNYMSSGVIDIKKLKPTRP